MKTQHFPQGNYGQLITLQESFAILTKIYVSIMLHSPLKIKLQHVLCSELVTSCVPFIDEQTTFSQCSGLVLEFIDFFKEVFLKVYKITKRTVIR